MFRLIGSVCVALPSGILTFVSVSCKDRVHLFSHIQFITVYEIYLMSAGMQAMQCMHVFVWIRNVSTQPLSVVPRNMLKENTWR